MGESLGFGLGFGTIFNGGGRGVMVFDEWNFFWAIVVWALKILHFAMGERDGWRSMEMMKEVSSLDRL